MVMKNPRQWLLENADIPILYQISPGHVKAEQLLENSEVRYWQTLLENRVSSQNTLNIHGSHDYRYENIAGKCFSLGLNRSIPQFDEAISFFLRFLEKQLNSPPDNSHTFARMYRYRDHETILACYFPFIGYASEIPVKLAALKRVNVLYHFTKQNRYDIYVKSGRYPGVRQEWLPFLIDPSLYEDGNIPLPSIHDLVLLAGMYDYLDMEEQAKIDTILQWILNDNYRKLAVSNYYYAPDDPSYKAKSIDYTIRLVDASSAVLTKECIQGMLFTNFILSFFPIARNNSAFTSALDFFEKFRTSSDTYLFPQSHDNRAKG